VCYAHFDSAVSIMSPRLRTILEKSREPIGPQENSITCH
jgi:hypothetical protein